MTKLIKNLFVDIGNTSVTCGAFPCGTSFDDLDGQIFSFDTSLLIKKDKTALKIIFNSQNLNITSIIISSVVKEADIFIEKFLQSYFDKVKVIFITLETILNLGVKISYDNPSEVGIDRLVTTYAAKALYKPPLIVVDFGTAITCDVISCSGAYEGGIIYPGIDLALLSLYEKTSKLPKVSFKVLDKSFGRNTEESMCLGVLFQVLGGIKDFLSSIRQGDMKHCKVVATGGYSDLFIDKTDIFDYFDKNLILKGLKIIENKQVI